MGVTTAELYLHLSRYGTNRWTYTLRFDDPGGERVFREECGPHLSPSGALLAVAALLDDLEDCESVQPSDEPFPLLAP